MTLDYKDEARLLYDIARGAVNCMDLPPKRIEKSLLAAHRSGVIEGLEMGAKMCDEWADSARRQAKDCVPGGGSQRFNEDRAEAFEGSADSIRAHATRLSSPQPEVPNG